MLRTIMLKKRDGSAVMPFRVHGDEDAGFDLVCCESAIIWPFCCRDIDTGWDIKVPDGHWGSIKSRSSTFAKRKLMVLEGIIDPGYTGRLSAVVFNPTPFPKLVKAGDRLIQLVVIPMVHTNFQIGMSMPKTKRGKAGFGSSDLTTKPRRRFIW
jgi:dUTP pyrophosphatase